ncbi:4'-phosphopantetheinyl transferase family protein [Pseudomonadota bacterium AL_CKDN230030165-1A_HGKHYDSX7]
MAWPSLPERLPTGLALHGWTLDLDADHAADWSTLACGERERAAQFRREADRRRYVQTRAGLRRLLARCLDCRPEAVPIVAGLHGKPQLAGAVRACFNVAHAGRLALVAIADPADVVEVGVDVEACVPELDVAGMAALALTDDEQREFEGLADRQAAFYARWVEKEAVLKAIGVGVSVHLRTVGIHPDPSGGLQVRSARAAWAGFKVMAIGAPAGYAAAVAWRSKDAI